MTKKFMLVETLSKPPQIEYALKFVIFIVLHK